MSTAQPPTTMPACPDRSTRLMLFGIFQILLGCIFGLMGLMMVVVSTMGPMAKAPQGQAMTTRMMIPGMVLYLVLAVALIWLGIGSIRARRWAWTLTVVLSWMWLIMGVAMFVMFVFVMGPMMRASMEQQAKMPPQALIIMQVIMGVFTACIYILLPALFLLFYHRASVRATCQRRDPQIRWTDRCPMPVLAFSRAGLMEMYEKMGMPAAQLEMMRKSGMIEMISRWMPWMGLVGGALWLGYLLYVRRYFVRRQVAN